MAQLDMQRAVAAEGAMISLIGSLQDTGSGEPLPRLSAATGEDLFSRAFDPGMLSDPQPVNRDLPVLMALQRKAGAVARGYITTGTQITRGGSASPEDLDRAAENFIMFLPEIAKAYDFSIVVGAHIARLASEVASQAQALGDEMPELKDSVASVTRTQSNLMELMIGCSTDSNIDQQWRRERLVLLNSNAPYFAALFDTESAQKIADRALAAAIEEPDEEIADRLKSFALTILR